MKKLIIIVLFIFILFIPFLISFADDDTVYSALNTHIKGKVVDLPLKHTTFNTEISGFLSRTEVIQTYVNPYEEKIEAVYVFPLPENAAVFDMIMIIGDRVVYGEVKEKQEAKRVYEEAKEKGQVASLLEQKRPNIFTQYVANILPGEEILIIIRYAQDVKFEKGTYEYVIPTVVGPRYIPGETVTEKLEKGGWKIESEDEDMNVNPPFLPPTTRSGLDIDISVQINTGLPLQNIKSITHDLEIQKLKAKKTQITLKEKNTLPNKDFVLTYTLGSDKPELDLVTYNEENEGYFALMIQPQLEFTTNDVTPREMIFVIDNSGSMSGAPLAKAKETVRRCVKGMNPNDSFMIIRFSEVASSLSELPLPNTPENIERGISYINAMQGMGGTNMIEGIKSSLDYPENPERMRMVVFMTDGYIGNEDGILSAIQEKIGNARLFSFGIGSSVNRYLLNRMAEVGRGFVQYILPQEDTEKVVSTFYNRIQNPLLTDISIDWGNVKVKDIIPSVIPDLFSVEPLLIVGRYDTESKGNIKVNGKIVNQDTSFNIPVELTFKTEEQMKKENKLLGFIWARSRIKEIIAKSYGNETSEMKKEIIDLAIKHHLMSKYTSFVAVEKDLVRDPDKIPETVHVPVEMPEGVEWDGVFFEEPSTTSEETVTGELSLVRSKPGDPILYVKGFEDTEKVIAVFPFGEMKILKYDNELKMYKCRFLVPRTVRDGEYFIRVLVISKYGKVKEKNIPITIDSKAPVVKFDTKIITHNNKKQLHFTAYPLENIIEKENQNGEIIIKLDLKNISVLSQNGNRINLKIKEIKKDEYIWVGSIDISDDMKNSSYTFRAEIIDYSGNFTVQEIKANL